MATRASASKGRLHPEPADRFRTCFERDRDRIMHSKAFRRLKHKTQVFINPEDDHYVTRLTHTLQVTQIGRSLATALGLNESLTEAISLGHDVGHSPFGHAGEDVLAEYVDGGWLHSEQSVRILEVLEPLNLTWEVLDGIRAHSWKIEPGPATPEGRLCRYADRIAYLTHDVDDAMRAGLIERKDLPERSLRSFGEPGRKWISAMIGAVVDESVRSGEITMEADALDTMGELREFMFERVYLRPGILPQTRRAQTVISDIVNHFLVHTDEIPASYRHEESDKVIQVLDYVSGMTDRFALRTHDRLFRPEGVD